MKISRTPHDPGQQRLVGAKIAIVVVGLATWFYGQRVDDARVRWLGIAFLAAAFLLRFVRARRPPQS